ncbi:glucose-6-phosphate isomerase, partial [Acinetobacter baumannii]
LGIWNASFLNLDNHLIIPYTDALGGLPEYLQQLEMESNGKRVSNQNELVTYQTAPLVWGACGCNAQHSFHQLLHQGTRKFSVDFII